MPTRRQFLERSTVLLLAQPSPPLAAAPGPLTQLSLLRRAFTDPPQGAKPMTRWWWFGGAVRPEEITRELTFMRDAGLRGAEIQPVYPLAVDDPARGVRNRPYFSEEWYEAVRHSVREARRLGLQLDFTLGSGWPYGGPFIPTGLAARSLRLIEQEAAGPRDVVWDVTPHLTGDDRVVAVVVVPVLPSGGIDPERARVLAGQPKSETEGARKGSFIRLRVDAFAGDIEWAVDLGTVHETAEVSLNGQSLGAAWKGRRRLPCGGAARPGSNRLEVTVANLWIHHVSAQPAPNHRAVEETFGIRWGRYGEVKPERLPPAPDLASGSDRSSMLAGLGAGGTHGEG